MPGVAQVSRFVVGEQPEGLLNGSNATFTTAADFEPLTVRVYVNGLFQKRGVDFNTSGLRTIVLSQSPSGNETLLVNYLRR